MRRRTMGVGEGKERTGSREGGSGAEEDGVGSRPQTKLCQSTGCE